MKPVKLMIAALRRCVQPIRFRARARTSGEAYRASPPAGWAYPSEQNLPESGTPHTPASGVFAPERCWKPVANCCPLQTARTLDRLRRFREMERSLPKPLFSTASRALAPSEVSGWRSRVVLGWSFFLPNVKEHTPLSARASVDHRVEVETTVNHRNRAADRGCCGSTCSAIWFLS
jgi:hypothetical protein